MSQQKLTQKQTIDFSSQALNQHVKEEILNSPMILGGVGLGIVAGVGALLFTVPWLFLGAAFFGLLGTGFWFYKAKLTRHTMIEKYLKELRAKLDAKKEQDKAFITRKLEEQITEGLSPDNTKQALEQFYQADERFQSLRKIIEEKTHSQLTLGQNLGQTEQVYLAVLDNLRKITTIIETAKNIDTQYIIQRKKSLAKIKDKDAAEEQEWNTLSEREQLYQTQMEKVGILLANNEKAFTELDKFAAQIADGDSHGSLAGEDFFLALEGLRIVAERNQKLQENTTTLIDIAKEARAELANKPKSKQKEALDQLKDEISK